MAPIGKNREVLTVAERKAKVKRKKKLRNRKDLEELGRAPNPVPDPAPKNAGPRTLAPGGDVYSEEAGIDSESGP